jgi:hypothetical protein
MFRISRLTVAFFRSGCREGIGGQFETLDEFRYGLRILHSPFTNVVG